METWGNWTFSYENEDLLAKVLNKFASNQCSLDTPKKVLLSSLAASSKTVQVEILSSSSDDSDIDGDFNAVQNYFPKLSTVISNAEPKSTTVVAEDLQLQSACTSVTLRNFDDESSFLPSQPLVEDPHENAIKKIVEILNAGDYDKEDLFSVLQTELRNRKDVLEIIGDVWPEIVTDRARHGFCEALVKTDVRPQIICEQIYLPWFETRESNLTGFVESLSKLIVHFSEYACKFFLVKLLIDRESILVKHLNWLVNIMQSLDQQHWCILLNEYINHCDGLDQYQIPVLLHLVNNCQQILNNGDAEHLIGLCRNAAYKHSTNRDFGLLLVSVIRAIDLNKFLPEMTTICEQLKGVSKFMIMKALKDTK
ncbi:uncharacterized protein LOC113552081 [Rhopalosiphum maidis]|uniref:uncharacterized protein LOC113552081 n=1 Tax=Rhopalosiphum maidis TaxID=43146 RepID=UPI000EFEBF4B|nr:uncharacterized protein LOC113552081 [Rhopalosiphum maidis]